MSVVIALNVPCGQTEGLKKRLAELSTQVTDLKRRQEEVAETGFELNPFRVNARQHREAGPVSVFGPAHHTATTADALPEFRK
jgi:hypothetical protein